MSRYKYLLSLQVVSEACSIRPQRGALPVLSPTGHGCRAEDSSRSSYRRADDDGGAPMQVAQPKWAVFSKAHMNVRRVPSAGWVADHAGLIARSICLHSCLFGQSEADMNRTMRELVSSHNVSLMACSASRQVIVVTACRVGISV